MARLNDAVRRELDRLPRETNADSFRWLTEHAKADHQIVDKVSGEPVCAVYLAPRWRMAAENAQCIEETVRQLAALLWESDPEGMAAHEGED